jgi:diguanylate cyclase (GGDEF)-like protein
MESAYLWDLVQDGERDAVTHALMRMRKYIGSSSYYEDWQIARRDGINVHVQVRCSDLRGDSTVGGLVLTLRDVTEQRQLEDELKHRAFHDALTGLPNRLLFQDRAAHRLARRKREGTTTGVLFVDLDDFKVVNDTMGHSVGDELLVAAGIRLSAVVRDSDTVARLGGDEFALLVEHVADSAAVEAFAERIVRAFSEPFALAGGSVITTATVGVATTEDSADVDELLRHADLALYAAKAAGKRQWRRYLPILSAGMVRRREVQAALDEAVNSSAFTLAYQPIVALTSGNIAGFEALVRWPHPQWGMMQPGQFIALAEETGHIVPLGSWVLGQAAADLVRWQRRVPGQRPLYVSVNVSARQFRDPGFVDGVRQVLAATGLAPSALVLELTESVLLRRDERIHSDLMELKAIGVKLAIDDFGTGYSSLSYLRELPIDVLKIDKSFVDGIAASQQRLALVEGIIRIATTLQLDVTAEGIETEVQRDLLVSMGCQFGQGYLLAMPLAADQAEALVRVGRSLPLELPRVGS